MSFDLPPYLRGRATAPLPEEELYKLIGYAQRGNRVARDKVILSHVRACVSRARYWIRFGHKLHTDDLLAAGMLGVNRAIDTYREGRGAKFITYAMRSINHHIERMVWRDLFTVRVKSLTDNMKPRELSAAREVSFDAPLLRGEPDSVTLLDHYRSGLEDHESVLLQAERAFRFTGTVNRYLARLDARSQEIFRLRFLDDPVWTLDDVARWVSGRAGARHVTRQRVNQIENKLLEGFSRFVGLPRPAAEIKSKLDAMNAAEARDRRAARRVA